MSCKNNIVEWVPNYIKPSIQPCDKDCLRIKFIIYPNINFSFKINELIYSNDNYNLSNISSIESIINKYKSKHVSLIDEFYKKLRNNLALTEDNFVIWEKWFFESFVKGNYFLYTICIKKM